MNHHQIGRLTARVMLLLLFALVLRLAPSSVSPTAAQTQPMTGSTPAILLAPRASATAVAAGGSHACALTTSGGVKCWGDNTCGQLGDGTTIGHTTPVDVSDLTSGVSAIAAGDFHTCAVTTVGGVKCWGHNGTGELGDGTTIQRLTPVDVSGLTSGVSAIAAAYAHTCALKTSGSAKCWGGNWDGQLGDGTTTNRLTPANVSGLTSGVSAIAAGGIHTCALTTSGGVKCWGYNYRGELGDGTTTQRLTPVDVSGLTSGVSAIAASAYHTCALMTSGSAKCWGYNSNGQLGDGTTTQRSIPVDVSGLTSGVSAIAAGGHYWAGHTCALTTSGGVKCWGHNDHGQLGDVTNTDRYTPVAVSGLTNGVSVIAAGGIHTCAVTTVGGVKCWGGNYYGQLGDGTMVDRTTPVDVVGFGGGTIVLIRDESGNPVNEAQVYKNGTLAGTTTADGTLAIPGLSVGDRLVARQRITEVSTPRSGHNQDSTQNWAYRVYITSLDIPASGEPNPFTVTNPAVTQVLTLKKSNPLIGFNIVASVEWDANTDYLDELRQGFNLASSYLYDATDGQMLLERVTIYDNAQNWDNVDYQLRASNQEWPRAIVNGILNSANMHIFLGRYFDGSSANQGSWTNSNGYRTQIHEFGHYGLGLYDSYFYFQGNQKRDGHCTSAAIRTNGTPGVNATLMDYQFNATEFAIQGVTGLWSDECQNTFQWQVNGKSDWETIIDHYQDSNTPPRWTMSTPASHNGVVAGPTSIPATAWTNVVVGGNANTGICATPPTYWVRYGLVPAINANIVLRKADRNIAQGKTNLTGRITVLGAANGDIIIANSRGIDLLTAAIHVTCSTGQRPQRDPTSEEVIDLTPAAFDLTVTTSPAGTANQVLVTVKASVSLASAPVVQLSQSGAATITTVPMSYDGSIGAYTGTATLNANLPPSGNIAVSATDLQGHTVEIVSTFNVANVTKNQDVTVWSSDGQAEAYIPANALSADGRVSIIPDQTAGAVPSGLVLLTGPYAFQAESGVSLNQAANLSLFYLDTGGTLNRANLATARIYQWNGQNWIGLTSTLNSSQKYVSASITSFGTYALMAQQQLKIYLPLVTK